MRSASLSSDRDLRTNTALRAPFTKGVPLRIIHDDQKKGPSERQRPGTSFNAKKMSGQSLGPWKCSIFRGGFRAGSDTSRHRGMPSCVPRCPDSKIKCLQVNAGQPLRSQMPPRAPLVQDTKVSRLHTNKKKTEMCLSWMQNRCTRGDKCHFAHGEQELLPKTRNRRFKTGLCPELFSLKDGQTRSTRFPFVHEPSSCQYMDRCAFAHPGDFIRNPAPQPYLEKVLPFHIRAKHIAEQNPLPEDTYTPGFVALAI